MVFKVLNDFMLRVNVIIGKVEYKFQLFVEYGCKVCLMKKMLKRNKYMYIDLCMYVCINQLQLFRCFIF